MSEKKIPARSEIPQEYKWNAESVYPTVEDWEAAINKLPEELAEFSKFQGHLSDGPSVLLKAFLAAENLKLKVERLYFYANMSFSVDATDQAASRRNSRVQSAYAQVSAASAFMNPELLSIGKAKLDA